MTKSLNQSILELSNMTQNHDFRQNQQQQSFQTHTKNQPKTSLLKVLTFCKPLFLGTLIICKM